MAALPIGKLALLLVRQVSKPIATRIKMEATNHNWFRRFCVGVAQGKHRVERRILRFAHGYGPEYVRPLDEEKAINNGAEFLSEMFIFAVGGTVVTYEYIKSQQKEAEKQAKMEERVLTLLERVATLEQQMIRLHPNHRALLTAEHETAAEPSKEKESPWYRRVMSWPSLAVPSMPSLPSFPWPAGSDSGTTSDAAPAAPVTPVVPAPEATKTSPSAPSHVASAPLKSSSSAAPPKSNP